MCKISNVVSVRIRIGEGKLILCHDHMEVCDGVNFFKTTSPSLLRKLKRKKVRQDTIQGIWIVIGDVVVLFKKTGGTHERPQTGRHYQRRQKAGHPD